MTSRPLHLDVVIIGGGVAGLWLLNRLRQRGYSAVLLESGALGNGQSIHAQGIIHGGVKYGLDGSGSAAANALAAMPEVWRECLDGNGEVDLRACRMVSEYVLLCAPAQSAARLAGAFASSVLQSQVTRLTPQQYPPSLRRPTARGAVYRLEEPVLDPASLIAALASPHRDAIRAIDWARATLQRQDARASIELPGCSLRPRVLLLTAGVGNESLINTLGGQVPAMRRRPLQQVMLCHPGLTPLFAHFLGSAAAPRLSITSHLRQDGALVWYLGGELANSGVGCEPAALISHAQAELRALLPSLDLRDAEWSTFNVERAEAEPRRLGRPNGAYLGAVGSVDNALAAWPVKLALCPELGHKVEKALIERGVLPHHPQDLSALPLAPAPALARPCWDDPRSWAG
ncbi:MAG: FAD-binding oxidoreductase [Halioglobus sp.]